MQLTLKHLQNAAICVGIISMSACSQAPIHIQPKYQLHIVPTAMPLPSELLAAPPQNPLIPAARPIKEFTSGFMQRLYRLTSPQTVTPAASPMRTSAKDSAIQKALPMRLSHQADVTKPVNTAHGRPISQALPMLRRAAYTPRQQHSMLTGVNAWQSTFTAFKLPHHHEQSRVQMATRQLAAKQQTTNHLVQRAGRYLPMVIQEVRRRGMPGEIALLPFVESGYTAHARSHAGAAGLWQFIPSTGKQYGLTQTGSSDARLDPIASTHAALNYLQKLNRDFNGDWLLSLAAYNCGESCVQRAVNQAKKSGLQPTFWNLSLPTETMNYVPKLLAYKTVLSQAGRYGVRLPSTSAQTHLRLLSSHKPVNLYQTAH